MGCVFSLGSELQICVEEGFVFFSFPVGLDRPEEQGRVLFFLSQGSGSGR